MRHERDEGARGKEAIARGETGTGYGASKQRPPRQANRKNGEKNDKKPHKNTGETGTDAGGQERSTWGKGGENNENRGRREQGDEASREKR